MEAARLAQARAERRRRVTTLVVVLAFVALVVGAGVLLLNRDDDEGSADATTTTDEASASDPADSTDPAAASNPTAPTVSLPTPAVGRAIEGETPCPADDGSEEPATSFAEAPPTCIEPGEELQAEVGTSAGPFTIALDAEAAPTMVNNFVVLARYGFYDGVPFHRLVPDFVAQAGSRGVPDFGSGGPGYDLPDTEKPTDGYVAGDVAMARGDTVSGSQFFVVASETGAAQLTNEYPRFGRVTEGLPLIAELAAKGDAASNGTPTEVVTIESIAISPTG